VEKIFSFANTMVSVHEKIFSATETIVPSVRGLSSVSYTSAGIAKRGFRKSNIQDSQSIYLGL
jgi:hypothetical protein